MYRFATLLTFKSEKCQHIIVTVRKLFSGQPYSRISKLLISTKILTGWFVLPLKRVINCFHSYSPYNHHENGLKIKLIKKLSYIMMSESSFLFPFLSTLLTS